MVLQIKEMFGKAFQILLVHNFNVGQIKTTHTAGLQQVLYIIICIFEKIYFRSAVVKVDQNIFFNGALHCICGFLRGNRRTPTHMQRQAGQRDQLLSNVHKDISNCEDCKGKGVNRKEKWIKVSDIINMDWQHLVLVRSQHLIF